MSHNIKHIGTVRAITLLRFTCAECEERADFEVRRANAGLPKGYVQLGERSIALCQKHFDADKEASKMWSDELRA